MSTASDNRDWTGGMGMAPGEEEFEEVLRCALRSAADCVEPAGDGLARIFRRLDAPWLLRRVSLLVTDCVDLLWLITVWLQPAFARAMSVLAAVGGSAHGACRRLASRAAVARLRPALAVAGATVVVMMGTVALSQAVARIGLSDHPGASALAGSAPTTGSHGQSPSSYLGGRSPAPPAPTWPGIAPARGGGATHQRSCTFKRCPPGPAGVVAPGPATTPSAQPSTSPSPSPSPTPTPAHSHHGTHQPHQPRRPHPPHPTVSQAPGR
jgi:hypothetical protein